MIRKAKTNDAERVAELALKMWKDNTLESLTSEFEGFIQDVDRAVFVCVESSTIVGFAYASLRHDYVEGTDTSPVGYLEGVFVEEANRKQGIARSLVEACENWAKEMDAKEFASDCELGNAASEVFHKSIGFEEANKIICFTKKL